MTSIITKILPFVPMLLIGHAQASSETARVDSASVTDSADLVLVDLDRPGRRAKRQQADVTQPPADVARVCFTRPSDFLSRNDPYLLQADGTSFGILANRRFLCMDAEPGGYRIDASVTFKRNLGLWQPGEIGIWEDVTRHDSRVLRFEGGEVTYVAVRLVGDRFEFSHQDASWFHQHRVRAAKLDHYVGPATLRLED